MSKLPELKMLMQMTCLRLEGGRWSWKGGARYGKSFGRVLSISEAKRSTGYLLRVHQELWMAWMRSCRRLTRKLAALLRGARKGRPGRDEAFCAPSIPELGCQAPSPPQGQPDQKQARNAWPFSRGVDSLHSRNGCWSFSDEVCLSTALFLSQASLTAVGNGNLSI